MNEDFLIELWHRKYRSWLGAEQFIDIAKDIEKVCIKRDTANQEKLATLLRKAHRHLRKTGYDMTEIDAAL